MTTNGQTIAAAPRLPAEQFVIEYADADFCELESGVVVRREAGNWCSSLVCTRTAWLLGNWANQTSSGRVLINLGIITARDPDTVRGLDAAFFSFERVPRGREPSSFVEVAPNLAVEVLGKGPGWKRMTEKVAEYLRIGADRAWVIDPQRHTLHVFSPDQTPRAYPAEETVEDEVVLPEFSGLVADFFTQ